MFPQFLAAVPGGPGGPTEGRLHRADGAEVGDELRHGETRLADTGLLLPQNIEHGGPEGGLAPGGQPVRGTSKASYHINYYLYLSNGLGLKSLTGLSLSRVLLRHSPIFN